MKKLLTGVLAIVLCSSAWAVEPQVITTGKKGLTYNTVYGPNLRAILAEQGYPTTVVKSKGAIDNLDKIASGEAHYGFAPYDAIAAWKAANSGKSHMVDILGTAGEECLFVAVKEGGKVSSEDDIKKGTKIAVQAKGSGASAGFMFLRTLESDYAEASMFFKGGNRALAGLKDDTYDAVLWQAAPDKINKYVQLVMAKNSGLKFIPLNDYSLNNEIDGKPIYTFRKSIIHHGTVYDTTVEVPCAPMAIVANADIDEDALDDIAGVIGLQTTRILGQ